MNKYIGNVLWKGLADAVSERDIQAIEEILQMIKVSNGSQSGGIIFAESKEPAKGASLSQFLIETGIIDDFLAQCNETFSTADFRDWLKNTGNDQKLNEKFSGWDTRISEPFASFFTVKDSKYYKNLGRGEVRGHYKKILAEQVASNGFRPTIFV
jgi:hypothetical protein